MQRDWDLIRQILLATEATETNLKVGFEAIDDCTEEAFRYNTALLSEAGLVHAMILPRIQTTVVDSLTWKGHEFLDGIRNEMTWANIKIVANEKSIALSFASIKAIEQHLFNAKFD